MVEFRAADSFNFLTYLFFHSTNVMMTAVVATAATMMITTTLAMAAEADSCAREFYACKYANASVIEVTTYQSQKY